MKRLREKQFINSLPEHQKVLIQFKKLIDARINEQKLTPFLKEHYWIFGTQYIDRISQPKIGYGYRGDFLLKKESGLFDMFEIKCPGDDVFTKNGRLSWPAKDAISQIITYMHKCRTHYANTYKDLNLNILEPEGFIIIGMRQENEKKPNQLTFMENLQVHNAYLKGITLKTYDELYEEANQTIERFKRKKSKTS